MPRKREPPRPIWVRANPRSLTKAEIAGIRETRHLTDLDLVESTYRALIWAGHRYVGELAYVDYPTLKSLPWMQARALVILRSALLELGIEIGSKARDRAYAPAVDAEAAVEHQHRS